MRFDLNKNVGFSFGWRTSAGLFSFWFAGPYLRDYHFHFLVQRAHWYWGFDEDWYDGPLYSFGIGPLFLICW